MADSAERSHDDPPMLMIEYYQPVFHELHANLGRFRQQLENVHPKRDQFWRVVPPGEYSQERGREVLLRYIESIESDFRQALSKQSVAYYLHVYRRISPMPIGENRDTATVQWTRSILEVAVQKYAQASMCDRIAFSADVPPASVLRGALIPDYQIIVDSLQKNNQLVLTDFGLEEFVELYMLEKLAYEVWKTTAVLRGVGKGATLIVDQTTSTIFYDNRSKELNELIRRFDDRLGAPFETSATGTVFSNWQDDDTKGILLLPFYNVDQKPIEEFNHLFELFDLKIDERFGFVPNFIWGAIDIGAYWLAHRPFAEKFERSNGLEFDCLVATLVALSLRKIVMWSSDSTKNMMHSWQRGYDGPVVLEDLKREIVEGLPHVVESLGVSKLPDSVEVSRVFNFLGLTPDRRDQIDVALGGPHATFLPCDSTELVFIDYAYLVQRLYYLFYGVKLDDQNFKGDALESYVRSESKVSPLTHKECRAVDGTRRQVDASFSLDKTLVIVECKAIGMSLAYTRGDPRAISYRLEKIDEGLKQVDDKAKWLAERPVGSNYDIRDFQAILPLVVTPFCEFMPQLTSFYWISDQLPRVLMSYNRIWCLGRLKKSGVSG